MLKATILFALGVYANVLDAVLSFCIPAGVEAAT